MAFKSRFLAQLDHSICQSRLTIYHFFPERERFFGTNANDDHVRGFAALQRWQLSASRHLRSLTMRR